MLLKTGSNDFNMLVQTLDDLRKRVDLRSKYSTHWDVQPFHLVVLRKSKRPVILDHHQVQFDFGPDFKQNTLKTVLVGCNKTVGEVLIVNRDEYIGFDLYVDRIEIRTNSPEGCEVKRLYNLGPHIGNCF